MRVLVVEDDLKIAKFLERGLTMEGHAVDLLSNGERAVAAVRENDYQLVILDLGLPDLDGLEVLSRIRQLNSETLVIVVSARSEVDERVLGLNAGADDYVTKPFSFAELVARIAALQRRRGEAPKAKIERGPFDVDRIRHMISLDGEELVLTQREYALLLHFLENAGEVQTRAILADRVWGYNFDTGTNLIDVYINYLRKKLGEHRSLLKTVRGIGYVLETDPERL